MHIISDWLKTIRIKMVIKYEDILKIITTLGDDENLRITVKQSAKGGLIAGVSCAVGGLIAGPPGLAVGGAAGGCSQEPEPPWTGCPRGLSGLEGRNQRSAGV